MLKIPAKDYLDNVAGYAYSLIRDIGHQVSRSILNVDNLSKDGQELDYFSEDINLLILFNHDYDNLYSNFLDIKNVQRKNGNYNEVLLSQLDERLVSFLDEDVERAERLVAWEPRGKGVVPFDLLMAMKFLVRMYAVNQERKVYKVENFYSMYIHLYDLLYERSEESRLIADKVSYSMNAIAKKNIQTLITKRSNK